MTEFNFEAFKRKAFNGPESPIYVGNAAEIKAFTVIYEEMQTALKEMAQELKIANDMIKEYKQSLREKGVFLEDKCCECNVECEND